MKTSVSADPSHLKAKLARLLEKPSHIIKSIESPRFRADSKAPQKASALQDLFSPEELEKTKDGKHFKEINKLDWTKTVAKAVVEFKAEGGFKSIAESIKDLLKGDFATLSKKLMTHQQELGLGKQEKDGKNPSLELLDRSTPFLKTLANSFVDMLTTKPSSQVLIKSCSHVADLFAADLAKATATT